MIFKLSRTFLERKESIFRKAVLRIYLVDPDPGSVLIKMNLNLNISFKITDFEQIHVSNYFSCSLIWGL